MTDHMGWAHVYRSASSANGCKWASIGSSVCRVKEVCLGALARRKAAYGQTEDLHAPRVCVDAERALIPTVRIAVISRRSGNCCQPCSTFGGDRLERRAHALRIWNRQEQVGVARLGLPSVKFTG